jgi:lambda repressor-like predicted transcriptional regulator
MTNRTPALPEPADFAEVALAKLYPRGPVPWTWLERETGVSVETLKSQLERPALLRLETARRIATALELSVWGPDHAAVV